MCFKLLLAKTTDCLSIHNATSHFWYQRVTAVVLIPLSVWLIVFLNTVLSAPYAETLSWLSSPLNAAAIIAWSVAVIFHAALGVQVVIEDYVSTITTRRWAIRATNTIFSLLGVAALTAIFLILFAR